MNVQAYLLSGVLMITCTAAQPSICEFPATEIGGGLSISSSSGYSDSDGCECTLRYSQEQVQDNMAKVKVNVTFIIDGEDEADDECPPFMFMETPKHDYYMCPKSMGGYPHFVDYTLMSSSQMSLYLHNPRNRRFMARYIVTGNGDVTMTCASSSSVSRQFLGSCPCSAKLGVNASPGLTFGATGDNYSTSKRLGIGFGAAACFIVVAGLLYLAYRVYNRRQLHEQKEKAAKDGYPDTGAANPGYIGDKSSGIYSEISPRGTPVKLSKDPDLNLNLATTPQGYVPYRGSTDSGLYSSASMDRGVHAPISTIPEPGYTSVQLQAPGGGSRTSSQPNLAGFGAIPGPATPQMTPAEVEALYAKPMKRKQSGSRTPSRHASRDSLNKPPSRAGSREMLGPSSRYASRDSLNKPPSRAGSREMLGPHSRDDTRDMMNKSAAGVSEITVGFSYNPDPHGAPDEGQKSHNTTNNSIETDV